MPAILEFFGRFANIVIVIEMTAGMVTAPDSGVTVYIKLL